MCFLNVQKTTSINWDFYKQKLSPSIVNIFEQSVNCEFQLKTYNVLIVPYAVVQTSHSELNSMFSNVFTLFGPCLPDLLHPCT